jgi:hypothetical protein
MRAFTTVACSCSLAILLLAVGCATAPASKTADAPAASANNLAEQGKGRIVFYRPGGVFGYGMRSDVFVDWIKVGRSAPGTQFYADVPLGVHHITVPNTLYSGARTLDVTVDNSAFVYIRLSLGGSAFGGRTNLDIVPPSQGAQDTAGLKLVSR